jgi:FMN phosphatase YigB (HAD superfamily)
VRTLIADVGDVLIETVPGAHHQALAAMTGHSVVGVARLVESAGLPGDFERGTIDPATFAACIREALGAPGLTDETVTTAWNEVIGQPVTAIIDAVVPLANAGHLVLASTTNPWHWALVRHHLSAAGLPEVPAVLSFAIGAAKPEDAFYGALRAVISDADDAMFVDDRSVNVAAALRHGLTGWTHTDVAATVATIRTLATSR